MISIFGNSLGDEELQAVQAVFKSHILDHGEYVAQFERAFAEKISSRYAVATNSCTSALFISLRLLDIRPGDEVIIPSNNFIADINAIIAHGATPVFADIIPETLNIDPQSFANAITEKTKAVILLHYGGNPCRFDEITEIAQGHDISIIEDASNAPFSSYKGRACGTLAEIGCVSFDMAKILAVGAGGMLLTQNEHYYQRACALCRYGLQPDCYHQMDKLKKSDEWWIQEISEYSLNFSMGNVAAAIGLEQLKKVDTFIAQRKSIWETYTEEFAQLVIGLPSIEADCTSSYYYYNLRVDPKYRNRLALHLRDRGIYSSVKYYPLHKFSVYSKYIRTPLPNSSFSAESNLVIPLNQNLTGAEVAHIVDSIKEFFRHAH